MQSVSLKSLTAIWSRDVDTSRLAGRPRMIRAIREQMTLNYRAEHLRLHNILERREISAFPGAAASALRSVFSGRPPSLQCLLFSDRLHFAEIRSHTLSKPPDVLFCDGVRTFHLLEYLADLRGKTRIVVDLDDLMSRRMQSLGATEAPLSLGYLHEKVPQWLTHAIASGSISKAVARYEARALTKVENLLGEWADAVVLISQVEGEFLQQRYREMGCRADVHVIPPPVDVIARPQPYSSFSRFVFIGTDSLPQNKLTIQLILDLWRSLSPRTEIHIFGQMVHKWPTVPGVIFRGYAPSLDDVYVEGSVLFAPGVLRGGLKTKVAEAFANGCSVIGNEITFEGLDLPDYPLSVQPSEELTEIIMSPTSYLREMRESVITGQKYIEAHLGRERFVKKWNAALG